MSLYIIAIVKPSTRMARQNKILKYQYKFAMKTDLPNLLVIMDETNIATWYFKVLNLPDPYLDGEYIFKLEVPTTFPKAPPIFSFLTPNGVFEPGGKICISIGEFHTEDHDDNPEGSYGWRPALGMIGFAQEVVNGMIVPDYLNDGVRIETSSKKQKKMYSELSIKYNQEHYAELELQFDAIETDHPTLNAVTQKQNRIQLKKDHVRWLAKEVPTLTIMKKYLSEKIMEIITASVSDKLMATPTNRSILSDILLSQDYATQLDLCKKLT